MGDAWGLGPELFRTSAGMVTGHDGSTIGQGAFLRFSRDKGVAVTLMTNGGDAFSLLPRHLQPRARGAGRCDHGATAQPAVGAPDHRREPLRGHLLGAGRGPRRQPGGERTDLARPDPKGIFAEMGEQPERKELVHYEGDSLIPVQADLGHVSADAFVGDDGHGRALYLHIGRAIRRAESESGDADPGGR